MNTTYEAIISALPEHFHKLLNVVCGDGELISMIAEKRDANLTGVDKSVTSIETARNRMIPNSEFFVSDPFSLFFKSGEFDVLISPIPIYYYSEIIRVLAPGGVLIMKQDPFSAELEAKVFRNCGFHDVVMRDGFLIAVKD